jgi:hypothetical protein
MRRDILKSWRWFFIGRLAVLLAFTPEVRAAEATRIEHSHLPVALLTTQQGATIAMGGGF